MRQSSRIAVTIIMLALLFLALVVYVCISIGGRGAF